MTEKNLTLSIAARWPGRCPSARPRCCWRGKPALARGRPANTLYLQLKDGRVVIRLRPDLAPKHVERIKALAKKGLLRRHRVPSRDRGLHGADRRPDRHRHGRFGPAQHSRRILARRPFARGTLGMARSQSPNSANSQFFICLAPAPFLDGQYTVFGEVISGMEYVDKIKRGEPPANPDKIISMKLAPRQKF